MTGIVLTNLAFPAGAIVLAILGGVIVYMRHRQPKSVDANMASFRRGLEALAPEPGHHRRVHEEHGRQVQGLTHVRLEADNSRQGSEGGRSG